MQSQQWKGSGHARLLLALSIRRNRQISCIGTGDSVCLLCMFVDAFVHFPVGMCVCVCVCVCTCEPYTIGESKDL